MENVLCWAPQVGQAIKDALAAAPAKPVVVELDWKESVLHEDDRCAGCWSSPCPHSSTPYLAHLPGQVHEVHSVIPTSTAMPSLRLHYCRIAAQAPRGAFACAGRQVHHVSQDGLLVASQARGRFTSLVKRVCHLAGWCGSSGRARTTAAATAATGRPRSRRPCAATRRTWSRCAAPPLAKGFRVWGLQCRCRGHPDPRRLQTTLKPREQVMGSRLLLNRPKSWHSMRSPCSTVQQGEKHVIRLLPSAVRHMQG